MPATQELGVFLTARGSIAHWSLVPLAINPEQREEFGVYETIEEFLEDNEWLQQRRSRAIKSQIEQQYATFTKRQRVERLDI